MGSITWLEVAIYGGFLLAGLGIWLVLLNALDEEDGGER